MPRLAAADKRRPLSSRTRPLSRTLLLGLVVLIVVLITAAGGGRALALEPKELKRFQRSEPKLGTTITIVLYVSDAAAAESALDDAFRRIDQLDAILSDYRVDSELRRLCAGAPHEEPVAVSRELGEVLQLALQVSRLTDGAFDVTVGPLTRLWRRARRRRELPKPAMLEEARTRTGYQLVRLERLKSDEFRVRLLRDGMRLDLGGVAKGYIVDEVLRGLRSRGVQHALVNAGGDIGCLGAPPEQPGWRVGVAPLDASESPDRFVVLKDQAIATSGDAYQSVTIDGRKYSHILDPRTGMGVTTPSSVTVIAPTCAVADAWASAISVLGPEIGRRLAEQQGARVRVVVLDPDGKPQAFASEDFPDRLFQEKTTPP